MPTPLPLRRSAALPLCRSAALLLCRSAALPLCLSLFLAVAAHAAPADETALLNLWATHQQTNLTHAAVADACRQFERAHASSPLIVVSRGLAAWHLLAAHQRDAAKTILESLVSKAPEPLPAAGNEMARHWLTRLDRETVVAGLRQSYARTIEYPDSVNGILPALDRWGQPWQYRRSRFKRLQGLDAQTFVLESPTLKETSALAVALKIPYASRITWRPVRSDAHSATFTVAGREAPVVFAPGTGDGPVLFVWAGEASLLLSDGDHWLLVPRPR